MVTTSGASGEKHGAPGTCTLWRTAREGGLAVRSAEEVRTKRCQIRTGESKTFADGLVRACAVAEDLGVRLTTKGWAEAGRGGRRWAEGGGRPRDERIGRRCTYGAVAGSRPGARGRNHSPRGAGRRWGAGRRGLAKHWRLQLGSLHPKSSARCCSVSPAVSLPPPGRLSPCYGAKQGKVSAKPPGPESFPASMINAISTVISNPSCKVNLLLYSLEAGPRA